MYACVRADTHLCVCVCVHKCAYVTPVCTSSVYVFVYLCMHVCMLITNIKIETHLVTCRLVLPRLAPPFDLAGHSRLPPALLLSLPQLWFHPLRPLASRHLQLQDLLLFPLLLLPLC